MVKTLIRKVLILEITNLCLTLGKFKVSNELKCWRFEVENKSLNSANKAKIIYMKIRGGVNYDSFICNKG